MNYACTTNKKKKKKNFHGSIFPFLEESSLRVCFKYRYITRLISSKGVGSSKITYSIKKKCESKFIFQFKYLLFYFTVIRFETVSM